MTTILATFLFALLLSLLLTPVSRWIGIRFGAMDVPNARKNHVTSTPRIGGLAIVLSVFLAVAAGRLWQTEVTQQFDFDQKNLFVIYGALLAFGIGFVDDFHRIRPWIKLFFQVAAASLAYWGGLKVIIPGLMGPSPASVWVYLLTVFWFVLIINAVNLVDGMDGLAGGIVVFACLVIVVLNTFREEYMTAMLFAALGGATLGFLRYNFNPASIFMGDGGSYFLGYGIAALSIMSSAKAQMSVILLIPILALGVPLFDTLLAPIRRFIRGKKMFSPDDSHIHHRLWAMGLNNQRVVWTLYAISCGLCILAVIVVNLRDERVGFFLIALGVRAVFFVRKLGYFSYFNVGKVLGWIKDLGDEAGISLERRSFLNLQMEIKESEHFEELWYNITRAAKMLEFEKAELYLNKPSKGDKAWTKPAMVDPGDQNDRRNIRFSKASVIMRKDDADKKWASPYFEEVADRASRRLFRVELPLVTLKNRFFGTLVLTKDLKVNTLGHYTLKRVEHLRRVITDVMGTLEM